MDEQSGCFSHTDASYTLRQSKSGFERGKRFLSTEDFQHLREVLLGAEDSRDILLQSLGITQEKLDSKRQAILEAALKHDSITPNVLPENLSWLLELDAMKNFVFDELDAGESGFVTVSTSWCSFSVELPGDPVLQVSSPHCRPWMLPWTIRAGDREWKTWSVAVPEALRPLASKASPNGRLLDGARYWRDEVWSDSSFWSGPFQDRLGGQLNAHHARQLAMDLGGWDEVSAQFNLIEAETGLINFCSLSLVLTLEPTGEAPFDRIHWYNRLEDGVPTVDWNEMVAIWKEAEEALARHPWLADWRAQNGMVSLVGHDAVGFGCSSMDTWVFPSWQDSGHTGTPDFQLELSGTGTGYARVYLGKNESTSVITYAAMKGGAAHWLYRQEVSFHPLKPEYLLVMPDGRAERREIAKGNR